MDIIGCDCRNSFHCAVIKCDNNENYLVGGGTEDVLRILPFVCWLKLQTLYYNYQKL